MSAIDTSNGIPLSQLTLLKRPPAITASDEMMQRMEDGMKAFYTRPTGPPDNAPQNVYATIVKDGVVVAKVYNSGGAQSPNRYGNVINGDPALRDGKPGPYLAQQRAEALAKAMGGEVVKATTAQTQAQWEARPPREFFFDEAAFEADRARDQENARRNHEKALASLPQLKIIAQELGWDFEDLAGPLIAEAKERGLPT